MSSDGDSTSGYLIRPTPSSINHSMITGIRVRQHSLSVQIFQERSKIFFDQLCLFHLKIDQSVGSTTTGLAFLSFFLLVQESCHHSQHPDLLCMKYTLLHSRNILSNSSASSLAQLYCHSEHAPTRVGEVVKWVV